mgnify:CR=1 FL=1
MNTTFANFSNATLCTSSGHKTDNEAKAGKVVPFTGHAYLRARQRNLSRANEEHVMRRGRESGTALRGMVGNSWTQLRGAFLKNWPTAAGRPPSTENTEMMPAVTPLRALVKRRQGSATLAGSFAAPT